MIVAELSERGLAARLAGPGLRLRTGPVVTSIRARIPALTRGIALLYADYRVEESDGFADFHVRLSAPRNLRRWMRPQVHFHFDGVPPFRPLPADQALPMLEWGLNWCISSNFPRYLTIHAAVVERGGRALLLPAPPGAGKSTLCAGLVSRGWRLLSDELALIEPVTGEAVPLPRPISLKNASIDVIRRFVREPILSATVHDTLKGSVAHLKAPRESVRRAGETARPRWIVLPRYVAEAPPRLEPLRRGKTFLQLADASFTYHIHGRAGFERLADLVAACECYEFVYSDLEAAVRAFDRFSGEP